MRNSDVINQLPFKVTSSFKGNNNLIYILYSLIVIIIAGANYIVKGLGLISGAVSVLINLSMTLAVIFIFYKVITSRSTNFFHKQYFYSVSKGTVNKYLIKDIKLKRKGLVFVIMSGNKTIVRLENKKDIYKVEKNIKKWKK